MVEVSCIILSNLNDLFVKERTIPSIIENSKSHNIEIIVVDSVNLRRDITGDLITRVALNRI